MPVISKSNADKVIKALTESGLRFRDIRQMANSTVPSDEKCKAIAKMADDALDTLEGILTGKNK